MAVNKRAVMRREIRENNKITKHANKAKERLNNGAGLSPEIVNKLMQESFKQGRDFGYMKATGLFMMAIRVVCGFGKKRLEAIVKQVSKESMKMDEMGEQLAIEYMNNIYKQIESEVGIEIE